jgi:hypothetical protein
MNFMQIFLFHKSSWRIWQIISLSIFNSSSIILRSHQQTCVTISCDFVSISKS